MKTAGDQPAVFHSLVKDNSTASRVAQSTSLEKE
jgi:hypothetical protein